jgi:hypothetical protein
MAPPRVWEGLPRCRCLEWGGLDTAATGRDPSDGVGCGAPMGRDPGGGRWMSSPRACVCDADGKEMIRVKVYLYIVGLVGSFF